MSEEIKKPAKKKRAPRKKAAKKKAVVKEYKTEEDAVKDLGSGEIVEPEKIITHVDKTADKEKALRLIDKCRRSFMLGQKQTYEVPLKVYECMFEEGSVQGTPREYPEQKVIKGITVYNQPIIVLLAD